MLRAAKEVVPVEHLAVHFHDTYGQALSNIIIGGFDLGVSTGAGADTLISNTDMDWWLGVWLVFMIQLCKRACQWWMPQ